MTVICDRFGNYRLRREKWGGLILDEKSDRIWGLDSLAYEEMLLYFTENKVGKCIKDYIQYFSDNSDKINPYLHKGLYFIGTFPQKKDFTLIAPISISWSITKECNSNCIFCCTNNINNIKNELSKDEIFKLIDKLVKWGVLRIIIGGGEPFLKDGIIEIIQYLNKVGVKPTIATNGIKNKGLNKNLLCESSATIQISLDTLDEEVYFFLRRNRELNQVKNTIKEFISCGITVRIVTVLTEKNENALFELANFLYNEGVKQWFLFFIQPAGKALNIFDEIVPKNLLKIKENVIEINKRFPELSICLWGTEKDDSLAIYINPDGKLKIFDYSLNKETNLLNKWDNEYLLSNNWQQVSKDSKYGTLLNFTSKDRNITNNKKST